MLEDYHQVGESMIMHQMVSEHDTHTPAYHWDMVSDERAQSSLEQLLLVQLSINGDCSVSDVQKR